ncbi:acyltransferase family protein [Gordonia sp. (in: high G+C Gram-positive bacteria)]|uniref:acyltransferase family protein n=1 Tax=Gordonia sp. (in: high G+C Gram-positive bacteria) TaxID=84139 RepID=UPI0025799A4D|nr:acyltransferase family protein [Gordonia sp. (in: high G+C Gram-positive bacteria)]
MAAPIHTATPAGPAPADNVPAYRTDLDGLRGIAIALVACFHVWFGRVSGGVDVFLALSGYFFLGSLLRHAIHSQATHVTLRDTINPWPRLKRLLRRLIPALFTVLIAVAVLTVIIIPQTRWVSIGRELIASALYYQNWHLAFNSQDYLAASSANSPLQHIWSMSVQGQFFVLTMLVALAFAALIKLCARFLAPVAEPRVIRVVVGVAVLAVALVSFYWAHMRMGVNQQFNYYDTFSRVWEPLAGGLLAIWLPSWRVPRWLRTVAAIVALALIVTCGWWIDGVNAYPGPWALVPVGSTLLIIWAGATALERPRPGSDGPQGLPPVNRMLASRWPVWLGSIAYALYLWHWPLLIFYLTWREKNHASVLEGVGLLTVSVGLAWLTKRYIEDPLRGGRSEPSHARRDGWYRWLTYTSVVTSILVIGTLVTGIGIKVWDHRVSTMVVDTRNLDPRTYPGARALLNGWPVPAVDPQPSPLMVTQDFPETSTDGYMSNFEDPEIHVGVYGDPNATETVALIGGSHAEMWISALDELGRRNHFKVTTYLKMGCPMSTELVPKQDGVPYPQCHDWVMRVMKKVIADKPTAVFTNSTRPRDYQPGDWVPPTYTPIFDEFLDAGIEVFGIRDTPWPHNAKGLIDTPTCLADGGTATSCATRRDVALAPEDPALALAATRPGFHALDLSDGVCDAELCPAIVGNIVVYKDWHHLSATYVRSLTDELGRQMAAAAPWTGPAAPR